MRKLIKKTALLFSLSALSVTGFSQGMHFSQYYNAPLLLNPANAGLLPADDYRVGVNYRKQWASIPVPYNTTSVFADFQAMRNKNQTNWLGGGVSFWNDKVGDGHLSLTKFEAVLAYHLQMGEYSMISVGASGGYAQRSVDFSRFTYGVQWDGQTFDRDIASGENGASQTSYFDIGAGLNYAFFPNENVYIKIGGGVAHINQPKESFYGQDNNIGMRPTGNIDALFKLNDYVIVNPSVYFTTQKGAYELLYGTLFSLNVSPKEKNSTQLILGAYHRWGDAVVGAVGLKYAQWKLMTSYDFTMSNLSQTNKGRGAFEMGLVFEALYNSFSRDRRTYHCPRF
jgi:type IX secretion system PorP/SprF family membrane protein